MSDDLKCVTMSWTCGCKITNHAEEGSPTLNGMTAWCNTHKQMLSACAYDWQTRALAAEKELATVKADLVGVINTKNEIRKEAFDRGLENGVFRTFVTMMHRESERIPSLQSIHEATGEMLEKLGDARTPHTSRLILGLRDELNALDGMLQAHGFPPAGEGTLRSMIAAAFATLTGAAFCDHKWEDIRNKIIESGEACFKCGTLRPRNEATESQKTT